MAAFYEGLGFVVFWVGVVATCLYVALRLMAPFIRFIRGKINPFFRFGWNIWAAHGSIKRAREGLKGMIERSTDDGFSEWLMGVDSELLDSQRTIKDRMRLLSVKSLNDLEAQWKKEMGSEV